MQYVNNLYDPQFVHDNAGYLEGDFVAPQFAALENTPLLPVEQDFVTWMGKSGKPVSELPGYGWISALQLVHGLKLAGPNFSQQKVIDSLNRDTHFDADGMIVPIDWTKQHNDPDRPQRHRQPVRGQAPVLLAHASARREVRVPCSRSRASRSCAWSAARTRRHSRRTPTYENFAAAAG